MHSELGIPISMNQNGADHQPAAIETASLMPLFNQYNQHAI